MSRYILKLSDLAQDDIAGLPRNIQERIRDKFDYYLTLENPLANAEPLTEYESGDFRFRIGDYRASFDIEYSANVVVLNVLKIKHRKDIYRKK